VTHSSVPEMIVLILAKAPVPGRVKTRLCPPVTPVLAADVAAAALLDTVEAARTLPGSRTVVDPRPRCSAG
jgi:glycosyltransferase A (GT-A) superfamily protein (DUF2064 family)